MEQNSNSVGLVVFSADNYGSAATNVALYKAVEQLGYSPVVLDTLAKPSRVSDRYIKKYLNTSSSCSEDGDYAWANENCNAFVVGSDQSWRWSFSRFVNNWEYFLLAFAADDKIKVSYAPSFGQENYNIDGSIASLFKHMLSRFDAVSVREDYAVTMCDKLFGIKADQVLDPVFLIGGDEYREIAAQSNASVEDEYLVAYILEFSEEKYQVVKTLAERHGLKPIIMLDALWYQKKQQKAGKPEIIDKPELVDWFWYLANASMVVTDSFHGTCFSLLLEKPALVMKARSVHRFNSLANMFADCDADTQPLFYESAEAAIAADCEVKRLDYGKVRARIQSARASSLEWLASALRGQKHEQRGSDLHDALVDYARMVRDNKALRERLTRLNYEEAIERERAALMKEGKKFLQAQALVHGQLEPPVPAFAAKGCVKDYFKTLGSLAGYTLLLACKDNCSTYWTKFVTESGLPLVKELPDHFSYIAVVGGGANLYERWANKPIALNFMLWPATGAMVQPRADSIPGFKNREIALGAIKARFGRKRSKDNPLLAVRIVSRKYDKETLSQVGRIMVNNVDCSINQRGINVVVIDNATSYIVDSFAVDLHADDAMRLKRDLQ